MMIRKYGEMDSQVQSAKLRYCKNEEWETEGNVD